MKPVVSIITPAFNASRTVGQAIQSAQVQSFRDWEMIVVDDCSTDDTCAVVEHYAKSDARIKLLRQPVNGGPARARNAALEVARGRYVAFLDSDDCWLPKKLERQLTFMVANNSGFSYTLYRRFTDDSEKTGPLVALPRTLSYGDLLKNTGIACLTAMIDRELVGPIEFQTIQHEDYALWLQLLKRGFVAHGIMEDLARYRVSNTSLSGNKLKSAVWVWSIYRNIEDLSLPHAAWCFVNYAWHGYRRNAKTLRNIGGA